MLMISERINQLMLASFHYRNLELLNKFLKTKRNEEKFKEAASKLEQQKKSLLRAINKDNKIRSTYQRQV